MPPSFRNHLESYSLDDLLTLAESKHLVRIRERSHSGLVVHFDSVDVHLHTDQAWKFICGILWGWVINGGQLPSSSPSFPFVSAQPTLCSSFGPVYAN